MELHIDDIMVNYVDLECFLVFVVVLQNGLFSLQINVLEMLTKF